MQFATRHLVRVTAAPPPKKNKTRSKRTFSKRGPSTMEALSKIKKLNLISDLKKDKWVAAGMDESEAMQKAQLWRLRASRSPVSRYSYANKLTITSHNLAGGWDHKSFLASSSTQHTYAAFKRRTPNTKTLRSQRTERSLTGTPCTKTP